MSTTIGPVQCGMRYAGTSGTTTGRQAGVARFEGTPVSREPKNTANIPCISPLINGITSLIGGAFHLLTLPFQWLGSLVGHIF